MSAINERQIFRLVNDAVRRRALAAVEAAPEFYVVEIKPPTRNLEQSARLHAMLGEIAKQVEWHGKKLDPDLWKRLATAAWLREMHEQPTLVPALDGNGFDIVFEKTSRMTVKQMSSLIEWVAAWGAQNNVKFSEPAR